MTKKGNGGDGNQEPRVRLHYIKGSQFRVIHADGAIGGITPSRQIHMSLYSERPAIPREVVHRITPEGTLGEVVPGETVSREGIVREMDVDVIMNFGAAKALHDWLGKKLEDFQKLPKPPGEK